MFLNSYETTIKSADFLWIENFFKLIFEFIQIMLRYLYVQTENLNLDSTL